MTQWLYPRLVSNVYYPIEYQIDIFAVLCIYCSSNSDDNSVNSVRNTNKKYFRPIGNIASDAYGYAISVGI